MGFDSSGLATNQQSDLPARPLMDRLDRGQQDAILSADHWKQTRSCEATECGSSPIIDRVRYAGPESDRYFRATRSLARRQLPLHGE
jgi:hypothetical protein